MRLILNTQSTFSQVRLLTTISLLSPAWKLRGPYNPALLSHLATSGFRLDKLHGARTGQSSIRLGRSSDDTLSTALFKSFKKQDKLTAVVS
jgi:hypothetical protein